jgi:dTDP-4-amino-4,6-dideoxygalactose transaminase
MSAMAPHQAAIVGRQATRLRHRLEIQRRHSVKIIEALSTLPKLVLPLERPKTRYNRHLFPVLVDTPEERRAVASEMLVNNIDVSEMYWEIASQLREFGYSGNCPVSESVAGRMLTLPNSADLTEAQVDFVAHTFEASVRKYRERSKVSLPLPYSKLRNVSRSGSGC